MNRSSGPPSWWCTSNNRPSRILASYTRKLHRHADIFGLTLVACVLVGSALAIFAGYWLLKFFLLRSEAYAHSVFSEPMLPDPKPLEPRIDAFSTPRDLRSVDQELTKRFVELGMVESTMQCQALTPTPEKYAQLPHKGPYLLALNLYNSAAVLPTLVSTIMQLVAFLGTNNAYVSIFENGSSDQTQMGLANFAAALTSLGVGHSITTDDRSTRWDKVDRIAQLSVYRNVALAAVNATVRGKKIEEVVFINDVYLCPMDALELVYQRHHQQADASCALDWRNSKPWFGKSGVKFYDNWVSRSITGDMLRNRIDILGENRNGINELFDQSGQESSRDRFRAGIPTPVYSCWNGMIALPAQPFQSSENGKPPILFRSVFNIPGECAASECKTLAKDFWAQGLRRWMIIPSVHVTYTQDVYTHPQLTDLATRQYKRTGKASEAHLREMIDWSSLPTPKSVVCYPWMRGFYIDLPYRRTREKPFKKRG
ncbi:BQ2448_1485 [Microbotryum intermedium]|uniref:BQ2448_1485 protein n=1 Tax=Microbotryum intermedium TaxID=269621 RepID=A0A238FD98_9BASI|nr:BQ2448_1485 [Microbotryum intermedium]